MTSDTNCAQTTLLINRTIAETRIAVVEGSRLVDLHFNRVLQDQSAPRLHEVYLGRVRTVDRALNAAFVDIGWTQDGFLRAGDAVTGVRENGQDTHPPPRINELLTEGQATLVQIEAEAQAGKGPRLTRAVALPARTVIYQPFAGAIRVSSRIKPRAKAAQLVEFARQRIAHLADPAPEAPSRQPTAGGYILRSAFRPSLAQRFESDVQNLWRRWRRIQESAAQRQNPGLVEERRDWALSALELLMDRPVARILCDSPDLFTRIRAWIAQEGETDGIAVDLHTGPAPLFEEADIEAQIEQALARELPLAGGGKIVFDQTEALLAIDVDSGQQGPAQAARGADETALRINSEAAGEIARQLRLRSVGGLVVIDFIHMRRAADRTRVVARLRRALRDDPCPTEVAEMSRFGLVELTRRRYRPALAARMMDAETLKAAPRPTLETCACALFRQLQGALARAPAPRLEVRIATALADWLATEGKPLWTAFAARFGGPVDLIPDPDVAPDQMEIATPGAALRTRGRAR